MHTTTNLAGRNLIGMDLAEIEAMLGEAGGGPQPRFRARQIYDAVYRQRVAGLEAVTNLPKALRERLQNEVVWGLPEVERFYDSSDGTRRYLLKLDDGKTVETVWMPVGAPNPRSRVARTGPARPPNRSENHRGPAEPDSDVQADSVEET